MRHVYRWIQFALGVALVASALPVVAAGPTKLHSLTMPSSLQSVGTFPITATVINQTPNGNSNFSSLEIYLKNHATSGIVIPAVPAGTPAVLKYATSKTGAATNMATGVITVDTVGMDRRVTISNVNPPMRPNWKLEITFNVTVASCVNLNATWDSEAYPGSSASSTENFGNPIPSLSQLTTTGCDTVLDSCSPPNNWYSELSGGNTTKIERLPKPGFTCDPVAFNVLFTNLDNTVEIVWNSPAVMLKTTTVWPDTYVNPLTGQPRTTWVAWEKDGSNNPKYIPVPACTSNLPPTSTTSPFPVISSTALMPSPDGTTLIPHTYAGDQARICAVDELYFVQEDASTCPQPAPAGLGCVHRESILYIRDDIWLSNR